MYYRRKILLSILQVFEREIFNTDFQKYLFLLTRKQSKQVYDFVPYRFGCFSFQSYADKRTLIKYGILKDYDSWKKNDSIDYFTQLSKDDQAILLELKMNYQSVSGKRLIRQIYNEYPYYAIKSDILEKNMNRGEIEKINQHKPKDTSPYLFSIGYEGKSFDFYLNQLVENNIKVLCDVRKNPISMKYGFSKKQLQGALTKLGIDYVHIPDLGIASNKRKKLNAFEDYQKLFQEYEVTTLLEQSDSIDKLINYIKEKKRIALTCFEAYHHDCHRNSVVKAITSKADPFFKVSHI